MTFKGFTNDDFNVFQIDGLDARMDAIKTIIRPKFEILSNVFTEELSVMTNEPMYAHIAKHARRTINPPNDTWVAFSSNPRGYKMVPHFQIGLWETHLFIWYAVIYEAKGKEPIGQRFLSKAPEIKQTIPAEYVWSIDHMKPDVLHHDALSTEDLSKMFERLAAVKKAELLCGFQLPREEAVKIPGDELIKMIRDVFVHLLPLYNVE
ncbi:YktB family protein [Pradoshia sp.]